jgi:hypothetical protein
MTAPVTSRNPQRRSRRRSLQVFVAALLLVLLLVPVVYLFGKLWSSTGDAASTATNERAAIAYARPLDKLHAALVDARYAAVRRTAVDPATVKAAIDEVDGVDRQYADVLQVRQRWIQLTHEIDTTIAQNTGGGDALRAYAASIALTEALLDRVASASRVTGDPGPNSYHLVDVALHQLPDVVAASGELASLAATSEGAPPPRSNRAAAPDPRLAVAADRLTRSASEVGVGLRAGTDPSANYAIDLRLLGPLDEFTAATDELSQIVAGLDATGGGRDRIDASNTRVKAAAVALETAVLDAFDTQVSANTSGYGGQRRNLVLAGAVIALAAAALLWLRLPALAPAGVPEFAGRTGEGRHVHPAEPEEARPDERMPNIVDARELLGPELVPAGRGARTRKRQETPGPR